MAFCCRADNDPGIVADWDDVLWEDWCKITTKLISREGVVGSVLGFTSLWDKTIKCVHASIDFAAGGL